MAVILLSPTALKTWSVTCRLMYVWNLSWLLIAILVRLFRKLDLWKVTKAFVKCVDLLYLIWDVILSRHLRRPPVQIRPMHVSFFINHKGCNWKALQNIGGYKTKIKSRVFSFQVSLALPLGDRPADGTKIIKMRATYLWSAVTGSDYFILCVVADEKSLTKDLTPVSCSCRTPYILYIVQSLLSDMFLLQISNKYSCCLWHDMIRQGYASYISFWT